MGEDLGSVGSGGGSVMVAIDPGLRDIGIAVFEGSRLVRAGLVRSSEKTLRGPGQWRSLAKQTAGWLGPVPRVDLLVLEGQQIYPGRFQARPDDLLQLAGVCGALTTTIEAKAYFSYLPRVWKGSVSQADMAQKCLDLLTPEEAACIEPMPASLLHNAAHSIGIGLFHCGRLAKPGAR